MGQAQRDQSTDTAKARVYLLVDSTMIRAGLERLLGSAGIEVAGECGDPEAALEQVRGRDVDVLLVDLRKPGGDGFTWGIRLREQLPEVPVLVVRENPAPEQVNLALRSGVDCVLAPDEDASELFIAIDTLRRGRTYLSPRLVPSVTAKGMQLPRAFVQQSVHLSRLEIEAVRWLALGQTANEVARKCGLPESSMAELISNVGSKLDCHSAADFTRFAIREGFLPREDQGQE